jgi:Uma2 family endonuclease
MPGVHFFSGEKDRVIVPDWVLDLDSFRRWLDSDDIPENARIYYLQGEVWIDMSREQFFTHGVVKTKYGVVVGGLVELHKSGFFVIEGVVLTNDRANFASKPDGLFVANETLDSGRARLIEGVEEGFVELEGTPDMVLEVVSPSSVEKDTVILRQAYWDAGIPEYWLVDARTEPIKFDILRRTPRGYVAARKHDGWVKSTVFGKAFRLTQAPGSAGRPEFTLEVR